MKKSTKQVVKLLVITFIGIAVLYGGIIGFVFFRYQARNYKYRYIECRSKELVPSLEKTFQIDYPDEINKMKVAKSIPTQDGIVMFIIKFSAEHNAVHNFLNSFPKESLPIEIESYQAKLDGRKGVGFWSPPKWFTKPIQQGEKYTYYIGDRKQEIYIDAMNETIPIVYINGWYHPKKQ